MFETWLGFVKFKNKAMREYIKSSRIFLFIYTVAISNPILAQEYDDMYFTKADRKQTDFNLKAIEMPTGCGSSKMMICRKFVWTKM